MRRYLILMTLVALPASATAETVYRWLDAQGGVHYGSKPPAGARQAQRIQSDASANQATSKPVPTNTDSQPGPPAPSPRQANRAKAREQLQTELDTARLSLVNAVQAYETGRAVRYGNERNYVRYLDRVNALEARVQLAQERVLLLERQLRAFDSKSEAAVSGQDPAPE